LAVHWLKKLTKLRLAPVGAGLLWFFFAVMLAAYDTHKSSVINRLESLFYDVRMHLSLAISAQDRQSKTPIVIVDIDAASLQIEGRWPWSRHKVSQLVSRLVEAGAAAVAFDVVFSEPERNPAEALIEAMHQQTQPPDWISQIQDLAPELDADRAFAPVLADSGSVLGFFFEGDANIQIGQLPKPLMRIDPPAVFESLVVLKRNGYTASLPVLAQAATGSGFVTTFTDPDGIVRHSPLVIGHQGGIYPSLSLAAAMSYLLIDEVELEVAKIGEIKALTGLRLTQAKVPTDARGFVNIPYKGPKGHYPYVSATKVLQGSLSALALEEALVFIGTSAIGLADLRSTPMSPQYPGVEIHASIADALINGGFAYRPDWEAGATQSILLVTILLLIAIFHLFGPWGMVLGGTLSVSALLGSNFIFWHYYGLDLPGATTVLAPTLVSILYLAEGLLRESHQRRALKNMFDQYVPPAHIDQMIEDPETYGFQGEFKELTVLFSDIRGFTSISESLSADQLKNMLNDYFTPITAAIFDQGGTIDKYVGDMVMAFWGAPIEDDGHPQRAVEAALNMLSLTEALKEPFKAKGLPEINIGIGINTGFMNVGDMGSTYRRAYTVLGDAVNLGSRLESITKFYQVRLLISEATAVRLQGILCQFVDKIQVKGKQEPVCVYSPVGRLTDVSDSLQDEVEQWHQIYSLYLQQDWQAATKRLDKLISHAPRELYKVYSKRIRELDGQRLPDDWDGTFTHTNK
jgi:adenylate cyclase